MPSPTRRVEPPRRPRRLAWAFKPTCWGRRHAIRLGGDGGRVERWRSGLGVAYRFPTLSFAGASLAQPCSVSTSRSSNRTGASPSSASSCIAVEALAAGYSSGSCWSRVSGLLSRRIHVSLQPAQLTASRQAVLPSSSASCASGASPIRFIDPTTIPRGWLSQVSTPKQHCDATSVN